ncbi:hypothetical protein HPB51_018524 [Rhipicephalus microplus]|uniref:Uncharacterized protein n=1 Tax=Rhipicephalus microplus TaxID=6941 RepID=A0A9J6EIN3_RHIMP|nr:hypothetical protein HPB51_018524 [Rhipicephalus microplus]
MASEQTPSRRSFLFDPVATDLISFEADGCNSTEYYGPLADPLLSFTGRDPFFGAPYGDASRLNEDHSPSQAILLTRGTQVLAYRQPPPLSASLEPRCAWAGRDSSHWGSPNHEAAFAARHRDALDVSDHALDPYSYARAATVARQREQERKPRALVHEGTSNRGAPTAASKRTHRS